MTSTNEAARFRVVFAGPHVSYQDAGRPGNLRFGVPRSGPMDRLAHAAANVALGNDSATTAIEVSLGGLILECTSGEATFAIAGGDVITEVDGVASTGWIAVTISEGQRLTVRLGSWGSWAYVAVLGDYQVARWLGHTATHSMSGFGGGVLQTGAEVDIAGPRTDPFREGEISTPELAMPTQSVRVVMGPQDHHFDDAAIETFLGSSYQLTDAYDRMGVRLSGNPLPLREALSIPSEPIVKGSVQVGGDAVATVLLADHQTTGGYPKIATIVSADLDRFAQHRSGDVVNFVAVEPSEAIILARSAAADTADYLDSIAEPGRTLAHRLMRENLITVLPADPASSEDTL